MYDYGGELRRAAQPTLEVIAWLKTRVQPTLQRVLGKIGNHLFDPGYTRAELMKSLRLTNNGLMNSFGAAVGLTAWRFVRECRLETAARFLRDTSLDVEEVSLLVGYNSRRAFSRLFHRWCGLPPSEYRDYARAVAGLLEGATEEVFSWSRWGRLCVGELGAAEADALIASLEKIRAARMAA